MKKMLDARIFDDTWFFELPVNAKFLFIYLLTNEKSGLIGCYELPKALIALHLKTDSKEVDALFGCLLKKVRYINGWVIIKNFERWNPVMNPSVEKAKQKLESQLPDRIKGIRDKFQQGVDTL